MPGARGVHEEAAADATAGGRAAWEAAAPPAAMVAATAGLAEAGAAAERGRVG